MGHFSLAVISKTFYGEDIYDLMEMYREDKEVHFVDYTNEVTIAWNKGMDKNNNKIDKEEFNNSIDSFAERYFSYIKKEVNGDTRYGYYYNPHAKWSYYEIGGKWRGLLTLKDGLVNNDSTLKLEDIFGVPLSKLNPSAVNCGRVGDLDLSSSIEREIESSRFWELKVDGDKPINVKEEYLLNSDMRDRETLLSEYQSKEEYIKDKCKLTTFAVLFEGDWYEQGPMGWLGASAEAKENELNWKENYHSSFIEDLEEDMYITIVDCYI